MSKQLAQGVRAYCRFSVLGLAAWGVLCSIALAHVILDSPNSAITLDGGSDYTIRWHVDIRHGTENWDLWYSDASNDGPWQEIILDLPKGDVAEGAMHSFDWSVPNIDIPTAWVRVGQDNAGMDYFDVSNASFSILEMSGGGDFTGDGKVNAADLAAWQLGFGSSSAAPADGDADLDSDVDGADFLTWQSEFNGTSTELASQSVPEPAATALLLLGMIIMLCQRR